MSLQTRRKKNLKKELGLTHSKDERIFCLEQSFQFRSRGEDFERMAEKVNSRITNEDKKHTMKIKKLLILIISVIFLTGCSLSDVVPEPESQPYSMIEKPYKDRTEIDHHSENIYKRTVAGTLKYIDDGDKAGLKKMLCKGLLDMDDIDTEIDALLDGFKGDITDTTYITGDLGARTTAQWSKTEAVACYESEVYVYTDKETYYVKLDMCSVNDRESDGKDSVGVTRLHVTTLDKRYGMKVESGFEEGGSKEYQDKYTFGDGVTRSVGLDDDGSGIGTQKDVTYHLGSDAGMHLEYGYACIKRGVYAECGR